MGASPQFALKICHERINVGIRISAFFSRNIANFYSVSQKLAGWRHFPLFSSSNKVSEKIFTLRINTTFHHVPTTLPTVGRFNVLVSSELYFNTVSRYRYQNSSGSASVSTVLQIVPKFQISLCMFGMHLGASREMDVRRFVTF